LKLVLDASVALAWSLGDDKTGYAPSVLDTLASNEAVVPAIWSVEVANGLLVAERKKRIKPADTARGLSILRSLRIAVEPATIGRAFEDAIELARRENLSCYDATYLDLAIRKGCPVATLDKSLEQACERTGVKLWTP